MLEIEIDGNKVAIPAGGTIMDAAAQVGIYIPHFCYHKKLSIAANCRMCLVQVEKAAKPMPACATPITDGMKVFTKSDYAVKAQKGVMEFLLINHPLDCPICDQGGECSLQDLAVGYGGSSSRYQEVKRVVKDKDLGPLVATDMTRCIHCTRCVRFGQEIAGIMEMGQVGRGEHSEIMPFINKTIDSELSGNIIDLCPVGALTSKPFRYTARSWELSRRKSVSPHDGLGSNLAVNVKNNQVMRVLPLENEAINECWLSDKDRFSYEGLNAEQRLTRPMVKQDGKWMEVDWQAALEYVVNGLKQIRELHGADSIGALAIPHQTLEELYLLQKLVRGLGTGNVDARLRQSDFSADAALTGAPWLGMPVAEIDKLDRVLLVGSTLRQDHPLLAHRLRQAVKHGAQLSLVNPVDDDLLMKVANKSIVAPQAMVNALMQIAVALASQTGKALPSAIAALAAEIKAGPECESIAGSLASGEHKVVLLGNMAQHHPQYADLHALAQVIADLSGAAFGFLGEAANSVGAYIAGAVPRHGKTGLNAEAMLAMPRKAYLLLGAEPELDSHNPAQAMRALQNADMVVAMSAYKHAAMDYADVLLPIAPFTETAGTFISTEGRVQSFNGAVKPLGETRPAWKVLRVLGTMLGLSGFDYDTAEAVRQSVLPNGDLPASALSNQLSAIKVSSVAVAETVMRIGEVPMYQADAIVRRAESLQKTHNAEAPVAQANSAMLATLGITSGSMVTVRQGEAKAVMRVQANDALPLNCVRVAASHPHTAGLGAMMGEISLERA
ncbi:NADH-quinone oxidoreductase subunit G [Sulfuriferula sp. AH1]|uniref:NADH-quinone oxidoreductase subunit NuoG n=1 Tax=Sulfuriferula sp. AH1 TaxID=1985873 RepID=UPI000B3BA7FA|nr:NADH-quinone oxidoreductase subunit NuoG [Sulfuriferula sp. AH1]ARU30718.1 NADH-quinone oxidoreductase subunit G [Sulfuriferula sp. AH1]